MLSDRYCNRPPAGGLLLYLKANHMQGLPFLPHEKRGMKERLGGKAKSTVFIKLRFING